MQEYSDPKRAGDPYALPDVEVYFVHPGEIPLVDDAAGDDDDAYLPSGWYWPACFPGCLPDGEPNGPFASEKEALEDAQDGAE